MSRFFSLKYSDLVPYTPGEQPRDMRYVKLNTNESPFAPSASVREAVCEECASLQLYSDPECTALRDKMAQVYKLSPDRILMGNGSDELLNFAFMAFADKKSPLAFADITYGFYPVFARLNNIPYEEIPLNKDFTIDISDYLNVYKTIVIANPNAPTGLCLSPRDIEEIVKSNPDNVVIIDEAYVDFGAQSVVPLIEKYDNLIVIGTFSKSRSMAGARLGYVFGAPELIDDINTIKYSTNPYNVNRLTSRAGVAALCDNEYYLKNCDIIKQNREWTAAELERLGFSVLPSKANFIFVKSDKIGGKAFYSELKQRGVLIRNLSKERIVDYNRVTIGTAEQMKIFIKNTEEILKEYAQ